MDENISFESLNLSSEIIKAIEDLGYESPSEIQTKAIPSILKGENIIVKSQTGTGKTAAFAIPLCQMIEVEEKRTQAVVLTPTRELAVQVAGDFNDIGRFKRLRALPIFGGQPIEDQLKTLKQRIHVIVSTPGRFLDHLKRGSIDVGKVGYIVIDEADEMFNMGFIEDVKSIIEAMPETRQMMLFSATMSEKVKQITEKYMSTAENIESSSGKATVEKIAQSFYMVDEKSKLASVSKLLSSIASEAVLVFCNTKKNVEAVYEYLDYKGFSVQNLHGNMEQEDRLRILKGFRNKEFKCLVATDVAARGLDIENITHVINYDIPYNAESYVHRIGRTGRAGESGEALTLVTEREIRFLKEIEEYIGFSIKKSKIPSGGQTRTTSEVKIKAEDDVQRNEIDRKPILKVAGKDEGTPKANDKAKKTTAAEKEITKLHISLGRKNKIRPTDIVGAIIGATGLSGEDIGIIDIYDNFSYVDIMNRKGTMVLNALKESTIKGKKVKVEIAKEKE